MDCTVLHKDISTVILAGLELTTPMLQGAHSFYYTMEGLQKPMCLAVNCSLVYLHFVLEVFLIQVNNVIYTCMSFIFVFFKRHISTYLLDCSL